MDGAYLSAAWLFVAFRALNSIVHCTVNIVMLRFYLYLLASLAVWLLRDAFPAHFSELVRVFSPSLYSSPSCDLTRQCRKEASFGATSCTGAVVTIVELV